MTNSKHQTCTEGHIYANCNGIPENQRLGTISKAARAEKHIPFKEVIINVMTEFSTETREQVHKLQIVMESYL